MGNCTPDFQDSLFAGERWGLALVFYVGFGCCVFVIFGFAMWGFQMKLIGLNEHLPVA